MAQGDENVRIHHRTPDLCLLDVLEVDGDQGFVSALQSVGDDDVTSRLQRGKAVQISGLHVFQRVFPAADVEGVAVREEGTAVQLLDVVGHHTGIIRPQEGKVSELPEVELDRSEFIREIDLFKAGALHKAVELLEQRLAGFGVKIRKVYF